jgi:hypothetical protein
LVNSGPYRRPTGGIFLAAPADCKCGPRNEKLGRRKLDETLFSLEGNLRLRDGVLYV